MDGTRIYKQPQIIRQRRRGKTEEEVERAINEAGADWCLILGLEKKGVIVLSASDFISFIFDTSTS
jgi:hypothetical protein